MSGTDCVGTPSASPVIVNVYVPSGMSADAEMVSVTVLSVVLGGSTPVVNPTGASFVVDGGMLLMAAQANRLVPGSD